MTKACHREVALQTAFAICRRGRLEAGLAVPREIDGFPQLIDCSECVGPMLT